MQMNADVLDLHCVCLLSVLGTYAERLFVSPIWRSFKF